MRVGLISNTSRIKRAAGVFLCALLCLCLFAGCAGNVSGQSAENKSGAGIEERGSAVSGSAEDAGFTGEAGSEEGQTGEKEMAEASKGEPGEGKEEIPVDSNVDTEDPESADTGPEDTEPAGTKAESQAVSGEDDISASEEPDSDESEPDASAASDSAEENRIRNFLNGMTLEQKVAQMFVLLPEQLTGMGQVTQAGETTRSSLQGFPVGGLLYLDTNLESYGQARELLADTQQISLEMTGLPMLTFIDEEGGIVTRISGRFPEVPLIDSMAAYGSRGSREEAFQIGQTIGGYLADLGFTCDCAPVADVLTNPDNYVIGERSFGSDPELVAEMAVSLGSGLEDAGVTAVYKHFPGHGGTSADTHEGYASIDKTKEELYACDLIPFIRAIENGAGMIMAAHITLPGISENGLPASLNPDILTGLLRGELGFQGLIITDALNMGAVANQYTSQEAAVLAVQAGADLLLMPADPYAAYQALLDAVYNGEISEERIDESAGRIVGMKQKNIPFIAETADEE